MQLYPKFEVSAQLSESHTYKVTIFLYTNLCSMTIGAPCSLHDAEMNT